MENNEKALRFSNSSENLLELKAEGEWKNVDIPKTKLDLKIWDKDLGIEVGVKMEKCDVCGSSFTQNHRDGSFIAVELDEVKSKATFCRACFVKLPALIVKLLQGAQED